MCHLSFCLISSSILVNDVNFVYILTLNCFKDKSVALFKYQRLNLKAGDSLVDLFNKKLYSSLGILFHENIMNDTPSISKYKVVY